MFWSINVVENLNLFTYNVYLVVKLNVINYACKK